MATTQEECEIIVEQTADCHMLSALLPCYGERDAKAFMAAQWAIAALVEYHGLKSHIPVYGPIGNRSYDNYLR